MAILKPNKPLKYVKPDGTTQSEYPLTSIDQVIDEDGIHRLNQTIVRADLSDVTEGQVVLTNSDLLENHPASYFATKNGLDSLNTRLNTLDTNKLSIFDTAAFHNSIVRGNDITSYYTDGTLWSRIAGTNGFRPYEDLYLGDYFKMSRPISAYNQDQNYQATGSQYVTIAGFDCMRRNGDNADINYNHITCVPGQFRSDIFHFGRSRMNPTNTSVGGYAGSEMHTTTIGEVATEGSTEATATINQQLYAEFGSHLKTTREQLSNSINASGYNRFGTNSGCSNNSTWYSCQAVLMSEVEVYGSIVWSSSGFDTGNACMQLPLFAKDKACINNRSTYYWLKDVSVASGFCGVGNLGDANCYTADNADICVRPRFNLA